MNILTASRRRRSCSAARSSARRAAAVRSSCVCADTGDVLAGEARISSMMFEIGSVEGFLLLDEGLDSECRSNKLSLTYLCPLLKSSLLCCFCKLSCCLFNSCSFSFFFFSCSCFCRCACSFAFVRYSWNVSDGTLDLLDMDTPGFCGDPAAANCDHELAFFKFCSYLLNDWLNGPPPGPLRPFDLSFGFIRSSSIGFGVNIIFSCFVDG